MLGSSFYYGEFEYPKGSGKWYKGNHQPMITKDLFLKVKELLFDLNFIVFYVLCFMFYGFNIKIMKMFY
jgi:hypothetical protein